MQNSAAILGNSLEVSQTVKHWVNIQLSNSAPRYISRITESKSLNEYLYRSIHCNIIHNIKENGNKSNVLLLLLLSRFSCVRLCDHIVGSPLGSAVPGSLQARTLEWVAIFFYNEWKCKVKVVTQSCPTLRDPMDCSLPGSSIQGIFQARVLEWGAIAFSANVLLPTNKWKCGIFRQ